MSHSLLRDIRVLLANVGSALGIDDVSVDCGRLHRSAGRDVLNDKASFLETLSRVRLIVEKYRAWKVVDAGIVNRYLALQRDLSAVSEQVSRFHALLNEAAAEAQKPPCIDGGSSARGADVSASKQLTDGLLPLVLAYGWRLEERQAGMMTMAASSTRLTVQISQDKAEDGRGSSGGIQASWFFQVPMGPGLPSAEMDETDAVDRAPATSAITLEWELDAGMSRTASRLLAEGRAAELVLLMRGAAALARMAPGKHGRQRLASLHRQLRPLLSCMLPPSAPHTVDEHGMMSSDPWGERVAPLHAGTGVLILAYHASGAATMLKLLASGTGPPGRQHGGGALTAWGGPPNTLTAGSSDYDGMVWLLEDAMVDAVMDLAAEDDTERAGQRDTLEGVGVPASTLEGAGAGGWGRPAIYRAYVTCEEDLSSGAGASGHSGRLDGLMGTEGGAQPGATPGVDPTAAVAADAVPDTPMSAVSSSGFAGLGHRPPLPLPAPSRRSQLVVARLRPAVVMTADLLRHVLSLGPAWQGAGGTPARPPPLLPLRPEFASYWKLVLGSEGISAGVDASGCARLEAVVPVRGGKCHRYYSALDARQAGHRGVVVSHLVVASAHQLVAALGALQQALLFNELLRSCFPQRGGERDPGRGCLHTRKRGCEGAWMDGNWGRGDIPVPCGSVDSFEVVAYPHEAILVYFCLPGADLMGMACLHIRVFPGGHLKAALFAPGGAPQALGANHAGKGAAGVGAHGQSSGSGGGAVKDASEDDGSLGEVVGSGSVPGIGSGCFGSCGHFGHPHVPLRLCSDLYATRLLTVSRSIPRCLYVICGKIVSQAENVKL